jgi:hypothetical protein
MSQIRGLATVLFPNALREETWWAGLQWRNDHTKFYDNRSAGSKVEFVGSTDRRTHRWHGDLISLVFCVEEKEQARNSTERAIAFGLQLASPPGFSLKYLEAFLDKWPVAKSRADVTAKYLRRISWLCPPAAHNWLHDILGAAGSLQASDTTKKNLRGFGPLANYADRATAACWRSSANFCG